MTREMVVSICEPRRPLFADARDFERELVNGFAGRFIRFKVCQLVGKAGITSSDLPDLQQDLAVVLFLRLQRFDPRRGHWNTFVVTVVERQIATMLKARRAYKRQSGGVVSLNAATISSDNTSTELDRLIAPRHASGDEFRRVDLRMDVTAIVDRLPADARALCHHLQRRSTADTARALRVCRATLYRRVQLLRTAFVRAGFGSHSKKNETREV